MAVLATSKVLHLFPNSAVLPKNERAAPTKLRGCVFSAIMRLISDDQVSAINLTQHTCCLGQNEYSSQAQILLVAARPFRIIAPSRNSAVFKGDCANF